MTLCPIALMAGCKKCPVVSACPLKGVIGNHKKTDKKESNQSTDTQEK